MNNIILIGMPGTGKSVVGRSLAERLGYAFIDADDLIVQATGKTLPEILRTEGVDALLSVEGRVGQTLECSNTVVATGGNAPRILRYCKRHIHYDADLVMTGLYLLYQRNAKKHRKA